jgi:hypothetical protein
MPEILRLSLVTILLTVGLVAYFLVAGALFPQRLAKTRSLINSATGRSFGVGLVNFVFFTVIAVVLFSLAENTGPFIKGLLTIPALLITAFLLIMLSFGLSATAGLLGERIFPDLPAWKQSACGTICLSFACAVPFVGWFLLLPYTGLIGIGAFILGFFQREPKP